MTNEELEAENIRLTIEISALRVLLGAVCELADAPHPADTADLQVHYMECVRRLDLIAIYAKTDDLLNERDEVYVSVLSDRAQGLREHAARPLRYTPKAQDAS